jgi:succinate dehydrogenase / fumarate reductase cytochrome b subunit
VEPTDGDDPLSPRLTYHWHIGMTASFLHRITGVAIFLSIPFGIWFLIQISHGEETFNRALEFLDHPFVSVVLFALLLGLIYHLINGLRYLLLDRNLGIDIAIARKSAWFTLIVSIILSVVIFSY